MNARPKRASRYRSNYSRYHSGFTSTALPTSLRDIATSLRCLFSLGNWGKTLMRQERTGTHLAATRKGSVAGHDWSEFPLSDKTARTHAQMKQNDSWLDSPTDSGTYIYTIYQKIWRLIFFRRVGHKGFKPPRKRAYANPHWFAFRSRYLVNSLMINREIL